MYNRLNHNAQTEPMHDKRTRVFEVPRIDEVEAEHPTPGLHLPRGPIAQYNYVPIVETIPPILDEIEKHFPGTWDAFLDASLFSVSLIAPPAGESLSILAQGVQNLLWTEKYQIVRQITVVSSYGSVVVGDNGYPIAARGHDRNYEVFEMRNKQVHVNSTNKDIVHQEAARIQQLLQGPYLYASRFKEYVTPPHYER